ncbi:MAG: O-antigen/teichoic acid export membrane protein [Pseudoalteromonas distincta]|jgi:O-antigen/teichoic acid export membrane protein
MSIVKKLAGDTAIYGIPSIVGRSINFLLIFFFTKYFTPAFLAPHVEFYAYAGFFFVVLPHGMETAFFNFARSKEKYQDVFTTAMTSLLIVVVVFLALMLSNKSTIGSFVGHPDHLSYVLWFALIMAVDVLKSVPYALLRYLNKAKKFASVKSTGIVINVALNVFFIVYYPDITGTDPDIEFVFITNLVASAVELLLVSSDIFKNLGTASIELWKRMFRYSWPLMLLGLAGMVNETFDRIVMRKLLPVETVDHEIGVYGTFYKLSMLMTIFIQAFRYAAEPLFFSQADREDAKSSYVQIMNWFVFACGGIFLVVSLYKKEIAELLIRKAEYHEHPDALVIVPILLMANLLLGIFFNLSIWYKLNDKTKLGALVSIVGAVITVFLLLVYVPVYGFKAAAVTTLIAYFIMTVLSYFLGQKYYPVNYNVKVVLSLITISVLLYLVSEYDGLASWSAYLINTLYIAIYGLVGYRLMISTGKS